MSKEKFTTSSGENGLAPDIAAAMETLPSEPSDWILDPPERLRRIYAAGRAALAGDEAPGVAIHEFTALAGGLLFEPERSAARDDIAILYFHGGGFLVGAPETHRVAVSHLAARTGLRTISGRYRLAPEHPFPAQAEDAAALARALLDGQLSEVDAPDRVILAGDSAGAAVAFWAEQRLAQEHRRRVAGIVGLYGAYGVTESPSLAAFEAAAGSGLRSAEIRAMYERLGAAFLEESALWESAAPQAPVLLAAAGQDPLRDDSRWMHARLVASGLASTLDEAPDLPHAWAHFVGRSSSASRALDRVVDWIARLD